MQQGLCSAHRKHRHHGRAAASRHARQRRAEFGHHVFVGVVAVAVGRFAHHHVGGGGRVGREHQRVVGSAQVAREEDAPAAHLQQQTGCTEDVARARELRRPSFEGFKGLVHGHGAKQLEALQCIALGVERQRGCVLRETLAVGKGRVFFLNVPAVGQQNLRQIARGRRGPHLAVKPLFGQQWQIAAVVQVRVGEQHGADVVGQHWQRVAVAQPQLFVALEQTAVDQQTLAIVFDQVLGAGDGAGTAEESDVDAHAGHLTPRLSASEGRRAGPLPSKAAPPRGAATRATAERGGQLNTASSSSMKMKPASSVAVAMVSKPLRCVSGMISWLTTNSMAPAASARPSG